MAIFGSNPNKGYSQQASVTGGRINTYNVNPGAIGGVNIYKTKDGRRHVDYGSESYREDKPGSGLFIKTTNGTKYNNYITVKDYKAPEEKKKDPPPKKSPGGGGGGGGGGKPPSDVDKTPDYGTTNPQPGATGSKELDQTTAALLKMIESLTTALATPKTVTPEDVEDVSAGAGDDSSAEGLDSTILTNTYIPVSERKKKSYLTPIAVG